jgi:phosphatidylserine/phosphatidylglycerophosphate/cardiolipin synthase-like enzyme
MNNSSLYDEKTFFDAFIRDLRLSKSEIIIESPFITTSRMKTFEPMFKSLIEKKVKINIITRDPVEHDNGYEIQSEEAIHWCECLGIQVFLCLGNHHRKLAIIDRKVLWEGSLNILSQQHSREIMRRIEGEYFATQMLNFLKLYRFIYTSD